MRLMRNSGRLIFIIAISTVTVAFVFGAVLAGRQLAGRSAATSVPPKAPLVASSTARNGPSLPSSHGAPADTQVPPCTDPSELSLSYSTAGDSPSHHYFIWLITNSGAPCTLTGYPLVVEINPSGTQQPIFTIVDDTTSTATGVVLQPPPSLASFYTDFAPCLDEAQLPIQPYTVEISFAGLVGPIDVKVPSAIADCSPQPVGLPHHLGHRQHSWLHVRWIAPQPDASAWPEQGP